MGWGCPDIYFLLITTWFLAALIYLALFLSTARANKVYNFTPSIGCVDSSVHHRRNASLDWSNKIHISVQVSWNP